MLSKKFFRSFFIVGEIAIGLLTSCSVGPSYSAPEVEVPAKWKNPHCESCDYDGQFIYLDYWWEVFNDEKLNTLEQWAIGHNRNLYIAFERIQEYRGLVGIAAADFYPQLNLSPLYTNTGELLQNYVNPASPLSILDLGPFRAHELFYFLPLTLSYEVDLWGKIRDQYAYAKYNWRAQQEDYDAVLLSLTAGVASVYYQMRAMDAQIDLLNRILKTRQKAYEINQDRYEAKIIFYADVALAAEEINSVLLQYNEAVRQRKVLDDQLAVLIGVPASEFCLEHLPLEDLPPCIPAGVPSEILLRRPDLAEAKYITRATHAMVKQAYSLFFPSLVLTSTGGYESPVFKEFLQWISRYWMLGAQANQIVFDGFRTDSNVDVQKARYLESKGEYQQLVLQAFQEVEDALTNIDLYKNEYEDAAAAIQWAEKAYQLYLDRYELGVTYYIDVVNTERDLLNYQVTQNILRGYRYISTIELIKALGGAWHEAKSPQGITTERTENTDLSKLKSLASACACAPFPD
jgi:outer membrane protein, multidrug efflux system